MNATLTAWRMHLRSLRNAARYDGRVRVALGVGFVFSAMIGFWSGGQLLLRLQQWQMQGAQAVEAGLWSLCWLTWGGMAGFTILGSVQRALGDDEALLLFSLPLTPAARFRILYGSFFIENLWNWLLLEMGVTGYVLVSALGWHALGWLVLLQLGAAVSVLCTLLAALLMIRYLIARERTKTRMTTAAVCGLLLVMLLTLKGRLDVRSLMLWPRPEFVIVLFALFLAVVLGPLAEAVGRLYVGAFSTTQSWDRSRKAVTLPGMRALTRVFARRRTLMGALFVKMLLSQSRNFVAWGRIGIVLIVLVLFPQFHAAAMHAGWSDTLFVAAFAAGLALLGVGEQAPSAVSGEANRLMLYLSAPFEPVQLLRAKLLLYTLPMLIVGLAAGLFLSWRFGLTAGQAGFALVTTALMVVGTLTMFVWGSAWDEDLNLTVEGTMQTIFQEETPITLRRMWLLNLGILLFVFSLLVVWKLPAGAALIVLMLLDGLVLAVMLRLSAAHLRGLLRVGL